MLEKLYRQYFSSMWRYARKITGSDTAADDVVQQAFLKLLQKEEVLRGLDGTQLEAYIVITVKNTALTAVKARRKALPLGDELLDITGIPEDMTVRIADRDAIEQALPHLSPLYRDVIALHYGMDLTFNDVAHTLGITPEYARLVASRARAKLRVLLSGERDV